jgi:hypothetical protein
MRRRISGALAIAAAGLLLGACGADAGTTGTTGTTGATRTTGTTGPTAVAAPASAPQLVVHRSPTCSCCVAWQAEMRAAGMVVTERQHDDMAAVKDALGVPADQRSCHTTEVGGYVVEGHVPAAAIQALLASRPTIDGIALAGMPEGAPGMPGEQTGPLVVTTFADGKVTGEFGRY